ncbi:hypothetical protein TorRG33x02_059660 [Trema orientale]|uniref:Uncharacterized protein n=1 Tax=Trema orientale TaxID=63057 RepID=A0A2P5FK48_TREOI|nr:hypothetical protein TorRG33x02_059660 [Trema orientale]
MVAVVPNKSKVFFFSLPGGTGALKSGVGVQPPGKIGTGAPSLYLWRPRVALECQIELLGHQNGSNTLFSAIKSLHHTFIICLHITRTSKYASLFIHILGLPSK